MRPGFVRACTGEIRRFGNVRGCTRLLKQGGCTPGAWNLSAQMYVRVVVRAAGAANVANLRGLSPRFVLMFP